MRLQHKISGVEEGTRTGICSVCYMVSLRAKGKYRDGRPRWGCPNAFLATEAVRRKKKSYKDYQRKYQRELQRKLAVKSPSLVHRWTRHTQLRKYGLTQDLYEKMVSAREGKCDLCHEVAVPIKGRRYGLYVDHDHITGRIRGLLCHWCNFALGHLKDRPDVAARIGAYLA